MADPERGDPEPDDVICHNDVCPENVVYRDGEAVALLDFEFAAPGRRLYDVASFARMCVPVEPDEYAARTGRGGLDPFARLRVAANGYGLGPSARLALLDVLGAQLARAVVSSSGAGSRPASRHSSTCGSAWVGANATSAALVGSPRTGTVSPLP